MNALNQPDQRSTTNSTRVYLMLFAVVTVWGANVVMIKYLTQYFSPTALAALRISAAAAILLPFAVYRHGWVILSFRGWLPIVGVAMFCIMLHQLALSWGLAATSGTHAALILALNPLFTTILAARYAGEPYTWHKSTGIAMGLAGIMLIVSHNASTGFSSMQGDLLIFIAMLLYVVGSLLIKKSTALVPPLIITAYSHVIAAVGLMLFALYSTPIWLKQPVVDSTIAVFLCSAWLATAWGALWWVTAIQHVGASAASLFLNISPIIGILASAVFLRELLEWQHFVALFLVLSGVLLGNKLIKL